MPWWGVVLIAAGCTVAGGIGLFVLIMRLIVGELDRRSRNRW